MASLAAPVREEARPLVRPQPSRRPAWPASRARPQARSRPRVAGGVAWIVVAGVLLAGIVALNVAVLRLNVAVQRLDGEREQLVAKHDALETKLSTAAAGGRIESAAVGRLGLVAPESTSYLTLKPRRR